MTTRSSFGSAMHSWAPPSTRSKSPPATQAVERAPAAPSPATKPRSPSPSASTGGRSVSPALDSSAITSPRNSRSFGADLYSVDYVKKHSLAINTEAKDPTTECIKNIAECDPRCSVVTTGGLVWIGERDGSITIRRADGELLHIIERRKGAFVWCMIQVGTTVWAGCSDGFVRVLSQASFKLDHQFAKHSGGGGGVAALAYHAASSTVFSGSNDFQLLAWDANTYQFLRQLGPGHSSAVRALLVDRNTLYSAGDDSVVACWDITTGQRTANWTGHTKGVHSLCKTEHYIWSGSEDATIRIWNPKTAECVGVAEVHTGAVEALTSVGDKVWSGAGDTVCVWDAVRLKLLGTYVVHDGYVNTIVVVNKVCQNQVWTAASDRTAKLWLTEAADEAPTLIRKLEESDAVDSENRRMREDNRTLADEVVGLRDAVTVKDKTIAELTAKVAAMEEELLRVPLVDPRLRSAAPSVSAEAARLEAQLRESEARNSDAALRFSLDGVEREYKAQVAQLASELTLARTDITTLEDKLLATTEMYESRVRTASSALPETEARIALLTEENAVKTSELARARDSLAQLQAEVDKCYLEMERSNAGLAEGSAVYEGKIRELQLALSDVQSQSAAQLGDRVALYESKLRELEAHLADVQVEKTALITKTNQLTLQNEKLNEDVQRGQAEIEALIGKVRDMDVMFKSRLSLLTDIYKMFKRVEACEKRLRNVQGSQDLAAVAAFYKNVIAHHFTDDELCHLGSSRHFFPVSDTTPSPTRTAGSSPRIGKAPPRRASPQSP
eukprot:NODE_111_length_2497_cov_100.516340_g78_i0.p1 GENE.NODE_111_length_2497_cov_100.516340_g78_i0~~NODE_111_length_2497_cov_100.516340_g78_i0.p1  ORF type:complete len:804 (-),score=186.93 NODE_111_length_2497_cov_100.516340_g78_i0:85-2442(-)